MTDRELLELAAKAAGYGELKGIAFSEYPRIVAPDVGLIWWNPLTDDGDALRLAVKLGLVCSPGGQVYTYDDDLMSAWADRDAMYGTDVFQQVEWSKANGDPCAATRRAIVRAAAEIGKAIND